MYFTAPSETAPTERVLVRKIGVSMRPHSITWVSPETSPAPLRTKPPPGTRFSKTFPATPGAGRIAVTPLRTGPRPAPDVGDGVEASRPIAAEGNPHFTCTNAGFGCLCLEVSHGKRVYPVTAVSAGEKR